ncbi:MAG TPA: hypothetical protein VFP58_05645 [Candidatus Eisenbacteria bacterium]|nr:hypothetical protein [Candidatus Eisenbacteria bacterium]
MHRHLTRLILCLFTLLGAAYLSGCADSVDPPPPPPHQDPETELTYAPIPGDTTTFRVRFFWNGYDKDGEVVRFRFAIDADTSRPVTEWNTTTAKETTFLFLVDPVKEIAGHTFMIASEDNEGRIDPTPARRFFSAKTVPPVIPCDALLGPAAFNPLIGPNFTFRWQGVDPDGGETGGPAPVDTFEYLLLLIGGTNEPGHDPLPPWNQERYVSMINAATGRTLPNLGPGEDYSDWEWVGIRALENRFRNATPGEYVFAIRAVDIAGATEKGIEFGCNIRHFTVSTRNPGPLLRVCSSVFTACLAPTSGPDDAPRRELQIFEGETISFSWTGDASRYGGEIVGYTYALDDTSTFPGLDLLRTAVTFSPEDLPPGAHFLFVRAVDDGGLVTNAVIPIFIVRPAFKEPSSSRPILYVDDSTAPGVQQPGQDSTVAIGNFPNDIDESRWWTEFLLNSLDAGGFTAPVTEWDATLAGSVELQRRKPPEPRHLAQYTTVIWNVDFNNSITNPTALWTSLVGGNYSELAGYMRAGGTLILTGFDVTSNTVNPTTLFTSLSGSICQFVPGEPNYQFSYFPRLYMGIERAVLSTGALRRDGARDFIAAYPTAGGAAMGFDSVFVDRGPTGSGAKWITSPNGDPETTGQPGIGRVDGWVMARDFGCVNNPSQTFRLEDVSIPIAQPVLTYQGVRTGVLEQGGPSPRQNLVTGIRVQAHDQGLPGIKTPIVPGNSAGAIGRAIYFSFPLFWLRDAEARHLIQTSYNYVNASPTLP